MSRPIHPLTVAIRVLAVAFALIAAAASAQTSSDLELQRDVLQAERKLLISQNMSFSDEEAKAFWPVYDEYAAAQRALNDRLIETIEKFAAQYDAMTDDAALALLDDSLTLREDRNALRRKYMKRFSKTLSGKRLARFFQIDNKLDTLLDVKVAEAVPLVR
jgi:hypothetical protein